MTLRATISGCPSGNSNTMILEYDGQMEFLVASGNFTHTFTAGALSGTARYSVGSFSCDDGLAIPADYTISVPFDFTGQLCGTASGYRDLGSGVSLSVSIIYDGPNLVKPYTSIGDATTIFCRPTSIRTSPGHGSYVWQVSDNGVSNWTTISGENSYSLYVTAEKVALFGDGEYGRPRYFRVSPSGSCYSKARSDVSRSFTFWPGISSFSAGTTQATTKCSFDGTIDIGSIVMNGYLPRVGGAGYNGEPLVITVTDATDDNLVANFEVSGDTSYSIATADRIAGPEMDFGDGNSFIVEVEMKVAEGQATCVTPQATAAFGTIPDDIAVSSTSQVSAVSCRNGSNGQIRVNGTGGSFPYTFSLSGPSGSKSSGAISSNSHTFTNLGPGTHTVSITDGCGYVSSTTTRTLANPAAVTASASVSTAITCDGASDGAISITGNGGTGTLTYSFNGSGYTSTRTYTGLGEGTYSYRVRDANNCTSTLGNRAITAPEPVVLSSVTVSDFNGYAIKCNGEANGVINGFSVSGGNGTYRYSKNNGTSYQTTGSFGSLGPATYVLKVKDTNGCESGTLSRTLSEPAAITASVAITSNYNGEDISCNGQNDATLRMTGSGGVGTLTYAINGTGYQPSRDFANVSPGTKTAYVRDANLCVQSGNSVSVTQPSIVSLSFTTSNYNGVDVSCKSATDGTLSVSPSGGAGGYTYAWSGRSETGASLSNLGAGSYSVTVTDQNNCPQSGSETLSEPTALLASTSKTDVTCFGANDGQVSLTVSGGTGAYSYNWNSGQSTEDLTGLAPGTYTPTITDANSCTTTGTSRTVAQPDVLSVSVISNTDVDCNGNNTGALAVTYTGGNNGVTYSLDNSTYQASSSFANLTAGAYQIYAKDAKNCLASVNETVVEPDKLLITITDETTSLCGDPNGSAEISLSGGNGGNTIGWRSVAGDSAVGNGTTLLSGMYGGNYEVTVTDSKSCEATETATIGSIESPVVFVSSIDSTTCDYRNDGVARLSVTGAGPFVYTWSNGAPSADTATQFSPGDHSVVVTDTNACVSNAAFNVPAPNPLGVTLDSLRDPLCYEDSTGYVHLSVSGGSPTYFYNWNTGQTSQDITDVPDTTYILTLSDKYGCYRRDTFELVNPPELLASAITTDVSCADYWDGSIEVSVGGGTLPYTYAWSHGETTEDVDSLDGGDYSVVISDANLCSLTLDSLGVLNPDSVLLTLESLSNVDCFGDASGGLTLSGQGGTGTLAYSIDSTNYQADTAYPNLTAGNYYLRLTDSNGCMDQLDTVITEPPLLESSITQLEDSFCSDPDGSATVAATGGTGSYAYVWRSAGGDLISDSTRIVNVFGGAYTATITDSLGCATQSVALVSSRDGAVITPTIIDSTSCSYTADGRVSFTLSGGEGPFDIVWDNGETDSTAVALTQGDHFVVVTDTNNCVSTKTVAVPAPDTLQVTNPVLTDPSCYSFADGSIGITPVGGTGAYAYAWSEGTTEQDASGLSKGTYSVMLSDANGCLDSASYELDHPDSLAATSAITHVTCADDANGSIDVSVSGGTGPYSFAWDHGPTTEDVTGLNEDLYSVDILDDQGCALRYANLFVVEPEAVTLTLTQQTDVDCHGNSTGFIQVAGTGGAGLLRYSLNGATPRTNNRFTNLVANDYTVKVQDAKGCTESLAVAITQPEPLVATLTEVVDSYCSEPNGSATVDVSGGTQAYGFQWRNSVNVGVSTNAQLSNVLGGTYSVSITDQQGCRAALSTTVESFDKPSLFVASIEPTLCSYSSDGQAEINVEGFGPFSVSWDNGETTALASALAGGAHTVAVTDVNDCVSETSLNIPAPEELVASLDNRIIPTCSYTADGALTLGTSGGTGPYAYAWAAGSQTATQDGLAAGSYPVTITDANDCVLEYQAALTGVDPLGISVVENINPVCVGNADGIVEVAATGGNGGYGYQWPDGNTAPRNESLSAGSYTVSLTDQRGCEATFALTVTDPDPFLIDLGEDQEICEGSDYTFSPNVPNATYAWSGVNGFTSTQAAVAVGEEGTYTVVVTNADGCVAEDSVMLLLRDDLLKADFLMVSEAFVGDTIVIIDITWPVPGSVAWDFGGEVDHLTDEVDFQEVIYRTAGTYQVAVEASLGECRDTYGTGITILEPGGRSEDDEDWFADPDKPLVTDFRLYPNPSDGHFTIGVELREEAAISMQLISLQANQTEWEHKGKDASEYEVPVSLPNLTPGLYVLTLRAGDERLGLKVLIR